jgi:hypothetical protein
VNALTRVAAFWDRWRDPLLVALLIGLFVFAEPLIGEERMERRIAEVQR